MLSVPLLAGMLREEGHEVEILDANALFSNFIASKEFYEYFENKIKNFKDKLLKFRNQIPFSNADITTAQYYGNAVKLFMSNKQYLQDFYSKNPNFKTAMQNLTNKKSTDINDYYQKLKGIIYTIFKDFYTSPISNENNLFKDWEQNFIIKKITEFNPELIGFSVYGEEQKNWTYQFVPTLKKLTNAKIVLGGHEITALRTAVDDKFKNTLRYNSDIFIYGPGETAFKMLAKREPLENIPNIIYLDENNQIQINKEEPISHLQFYKPNYAGINFDNYFLPKPILSVESARGCYWNKCDFCTFIDCINYKEKPVDLVIEELKEYVYKYGINNFFFVDSCVLKDYAEEFARKVIENKLEINYTRWLRFEKEFDYDFFKLMYDSGLKLIYWGLESGSDRILKLYNKGTNSETNAKLLKIAKSANIYNFCFVMYNLLGETKEDLDLTKKFVTDNYENIDYVETNHFAIIRNARLLQHWEEFNLTKEFVDEFTKYKHAIGIYPDFPEDVKIYGNKTNQEILDLYKSKRDAVFFNWYGILPFIH